MLRKALLFERRDVPDGTSRSRELLDAGYRPYSKNKLRKLSYYAGAGLEPAPERFLNLNLL